MYESKIRSDELNQLYSALLKLNSIEDCYRFFDDLCTFSEVKAMAQRFMVARMLEDGKTFTQIEEETGTSSATITRVNRCMKYGADGYKLALERMKNGSGA